MLRTVTANLVCKRSNTYILTGTVEAKGFRHSRGPESPAVSWPLSNNGFAAQLDISYDSFVRTTDARHEALVTAMLERVWERGDIYKSDYEGFYCIDCEEYKDAADMDEQNNCPIHRRPCVNRKEENYFFRLSRYQQQIEARHVSRYLFDMRATP